MQFSKVYGKVDPKLVRQAEEKLTQVFLDLGTGYENTHVGTGLGGDPLVFSLVYPMEHICTLNMPTAATDGKRYYWNPKFVLKMSKIGLRVITMHESMHAMYLHPNRRGSRNPKLWNIAVDYIVNGIAMEDLKIRKQNAADIFTKNVGRFITLKQFAEMIKNPFAKMAGFEDVTPENNTGNNIKMPSPKEDRDLTPEEQKELERREKAFKYFYADDNLEEDMKRPEKIYDFLYKLLPKCPKCGRIGVYKMPNKGQKGKKGKGDKGDKGDDKDKDKNGQNGQGQDQDDQDQDQGQGQCCDGDCCGCPECGGGMDIFQLGGSTIDDHIDTEESEEKLAKRIADAMESAKRMAGKIPAALECELGKLTAPKVTWQDIVRTRLMKCRSGKGRNDWTRFKTRPMFSGLLVPKKRSYFAQFGCLLDTSGSMSENDMAFGLSQLCSLDDKCEGILTYADATVYFDDSVLLKKCNAEEIMSKIKPIGRGGTVFGSYFEEYEQHIGKCDFLIVITDGYLYEDLATLKDPGVDVIWLITSECDFVPPFGRKFSLRNL